MYEPKTNRTKERSGKTTVTLGDSDPPLSVISKKGGGLISKDAKDLENYR